jgi:hypothetical protein
MRHTLALLVSTLLTAGAAANATADSALPDAAKWNSPAIVRVLDQNTGALLSGIYRRGGINDGASTLATNNDLLLIDPNSIHTLEATVTLLDGSAVGGGFTTFPRASVEGFFYWNGGGTGSATDQTGHVLAATTLAMNPTSGQPEARYFVVRCNDAACSTTTSLGGAAIMPVSFFKAYRLKVSYDGAVFTFQVDDHTPATLVAPDATRNPPTNQFKALRTRTLLPASATASASVVALFEGVAVNGAAYEAFDARELPRAQVLPASGTFSSTQSFDIVLMIETADEPVTDVKVTVNGVDATNVLPLATQGTIDGGGATYRFASVPASLIGVGTQAVIGVLATTASGKTARGFATWSIVAVTE